MVSLPHLRPVSYAEKRSGRTNDTCRCLFRPSSKDSLRGVTPNVLFSTDFHRRAAIQSANMNDWRILIYCDDSGVPIYISKDLDAFLEMMRFPEFADEPSE